MIETTYEIKPPNCKVNMAYYPTLYGEQQYFQCFLERVQSCFSNFIRYDINNRQYTVLIYLFSEDNYLKIEHKSKLMFDNSEVSLHFQAITESLVNLKQFLSVLEERTVRQKQFMIATLKKNVMGAIKDYFEYLIPYLKMDMRRTFTNIFSI